jgi:RNA polymerase sigma-70 factor (ECF subfamily)
MASSKEQQLKLWMMESLKGDQRSYRLLLEESARMLSEYFRTRIYRQDLIEDLIQDTLLSIHRARSTYNPSLPYTNWMYSIAYRRYIDYVRKQSRIDRMELSGETILPLIANQEKENPEDTIDREAVLRAIKDLPERQKEIVRMLKIDGLSVKEAASILDMSETALKVAAHRAYKKIRAKLSGGKSSLKDKRS